MMCGNRKMNDFHDENDTMEKCKRNEIEKQMCVRVKEIQMCKCSGGLGIANEGRGSVVYGYGF